MLISSPTTVGGEMARGSDAQPSPPQPQQPQQHHHRTLALLRAEELAQLHHAQRMEAMRGRHAQECQSLERTHATVLTRLRLDHAGQTAAVRARHTRRLERLVTAAEADTLRLQREIAARIEQERSDGEATRDALRQALAAEISELQDKRIAVGAKLRHCERLLRAEAMKVESETIDALRVRINFMKDAQVPWEDRADDCDDLEVRLERYQRLLKSLMASPSKEAPPQSQQQVKVLFA